jgi:hypothetical protein
MALDLYSGLNAIYQISDVEQVIGQGMFDQIRRGEASLVEGAEFDDYVVIAKCRDTFSIDDAITHFSGMYGSNLVVVECGRKPDSCPDWLDAEFGNSMDWYQVRHIEERGT